MAYIAQEGKAKIVAALKAVMPAGWKYSVAIRHHSEVVLTISQAPLDLIAEINAKNLEEAQRKGNNFYRVQDGYCQINHFYLENGFAGQALEVMEAAKQALYSADYYDDSDSQIDYFNCAYYVSMQVGKWNKPFKFAPAVEALAA